MTLAAIATLPKATHNTSTLNTGQALSNYSVKVSLSPHKSSHGTFLNSLTVDFFKIPDVNQWLKRRLTALAFKTFFTKSLAWSEISMNFHLAVVSPKTCYCQQQSLQYLILPSQAWDHSFTHVARNEMKYRKVLDAADFARSENCSFIRLNNSILYFTL